MLVINLLLLIYLFKVSQYIKSHSDWIYFRSVYVVMATIDKAIGLSPIWKQVDSYGNTCNRLSVITRLIFYRMPSPDTRSRWRKKYILVHDLRKQDLIRYIFKLTILWPVYATKCCCITCWCFSFAVFTSLWAAFHQLRTLYTALPGKSIQNGMLLPQTPSPGFKIYNLS